MTTEHQIEPKTFRMRKRPKKTASNARITREPFGDNSTKVLPIPTFIDDYNHYMGGIDQSNQLRAAFTTHFPRNQKEFFPGVFWAIDMAISNSYKLHLAINGVKTSSTGKRDPQQHRKWIEDLVDLLFQVNNDNFELDFTSKPYSKYQYQAVSTEPKIATKEAFLQAINGFTVDHLYDLHPLKKRGYCFFCEKKESLKPLKEQDLADFNFKTTFKLEKSNLTEVLKSKQLKRKQLRTKRVKWWCKNCEKFICKDCWSLYH